MLYTDRQWQFVFDLHRRGYTYVELADWLGTNRETIRRNLLRLGLTYSREDIKPPLNTYNRDFAKLGGENDCLIPH